MPGWGFLGRWRVRRRLFGGLAFIGFALTGLAALQAQDGELKMASLGECRLESGRTIENCQIGYRTFGQLNAGRDNGVLMPTWLYGKSGDMTGLFGSSAGRLVDTSRFFGIAIDALGDGVSSSPSNSATQHGTAFPEFTLVDSVEAEYRVMTEVLHLTHLHAVVGISMGGEQTFVWAVRHPEFFDLAVPILGTPRLTSYDLHVKQIMLDSILDDGAYEHGEYKTEPALKLANSIGVLVVTSPAYRNRETPRDRLEAFLAQAEGPLGIDANDRVWQLKAIMRQDVIGKRTVAEAARGVRARFLVVVNAEDHLVNPQPALDWAAAIGAETCVSHGDCAHLIMSCDGAAVTARVRTFLAAGK